MYWLPAIVLVAHIIEEYPRFPEWATRHFGATSRAWYVYSHILLVSVVVGICACSQLAAAERVWPMMAMTVQWALGTNAVFHIVTTVLFREYSPGLVTGTLLFIPATTYMLTLEVKQKLLTLPQIVSVIALGTVLGAAAVASLWLRLDYDWQLRRKEL